MASTNAAVTWWVAALVVSWRPVATTEDAGSQIVGVVSERYYELFFDARSYSSSEDACDESEDFLAVLSDPAALHQVSLQSLNVSVLRAAAEHATVTNRTRFFWIGLERKEGGRWRWNDGTRFKGTFSSDTSDEAEKHFRCAGVVTSPFHDPVLQRRDCESKAPYLCQYDPKPCAPSVALTGSSSGGPYIPCDRAAALQNRDELVNDCSCPAGQVLHTIDQVLCNQRLWYWNAYCIDGCRRADPPKGSMPLDERRAYWRGASAAFLCPRQNDDAARTTTYRTVSLTCKQGGLWAGYQRGSFCDDDATATLERELPAVLFRAAQGEDVVLECATDAAKWFNAWTWLRRDAALDEDARHRVHPSSGRLRIQRVGRDDEGAYVCVGVYRNVSVPTKAYALIVDASGPRHSAAPPKRSLGLDVRLGALLLWMAVRRR